MPLLPAVLMTAVGCFAGLMLTTRAPSTADTTPTGSPQRQMTAVDALPILGCVQATGAAITVVLTVTAAASPTPIPIRVRLLTALIHAHRDDRLQHLLIPGRWVSACVSALAPITRP